MVDAVHVLIREASIAILKHCCQLATLGAVAACGGGGGDGSSDAPSQLGRAQLSWDPPAGANFSGYRVHIGTASGSYGESLSVDKSRTSATVEGLTRGRLYYFVVSAHDDVTDSEGPFSNEVYKNIQ